MGKPYPRFGPYNVVADTNALYALDSRKLVSAGFEAALTELRKVAAVNLFIPDVVIGELAYQKFYAAAGAITVVNSKLNLLAELTGARSPKIHSHQQAKEKILKRYEAWRKTVKAKRLTPNIHQSAWDKIVDDAIWRTPPFEHSEDKKHEKGFRDRVVLESVFQICSQHASETILLCEDGLLGKAAASCGIKHLTIVPRLEDFTSRVRLLKEKETKEWGETLFAEATREFYDKDKPNCFYWRENVYKRIIERTADLLTPPSDKGLLAILEPTNWERKTEERVTLGTTQYQKHEAGRYFWKTEVKLAAAFYGKGFLETPYENIRISTFAVHWSSQANSNADIIDPKFLEISLVNRQMILDTVETRNQWALPAKPIPAPPSLTDLIGLPPSNPPK